MKRLVWLDIAKGLAILWVVYFHFFKTYRVGTVSDVRALYRRHRGRAWLGQRVCGDPDNRHDRVVCDLRCRFSRGRAFYHCQRMVAGFGHGERMIDISMNFMYLNAAWWYFSMLIQLYLLFPLLYMGMRKLGLWPFLVLAFAVAFITRYLLLNVWHAQGG